MNRLAFIPFAACLYCVGAAAQTDFKSYINNEVKLVSQAFATKDCDFFKTIAAPGFTESQGGKSYTAPQAMQQIKNEFAMCKAMSFQLRLLSVKSSGNVGTVVAIGHTVVAMKPGKDGKSQVVGMEVRETQTWVRSGKSWKLKYRVAGSPTNMTVNGRPLKDQA